MNVFGILSKVTGELAGIRGFYEGFRRVKAIQEVLGDSWTFHWATAVFKDISDQDFRVISEYSRVLRRL